MDLFLAFMWFVALATIMLFGIWRLEVNTRALAETTDLLIRVERFFVEQSLGDRPASPPKPLEVLAVKPEPAADAELRRIPRPSFNTLVEGSEPRDTTPNINEASFNDDDDDEHRPTTVLPRCGVCGAVNYQPVGGLFRCSACGKVGHLSFPGLERKVA